MRNIVRGRCLDLRLLLVVVAALLLLAPADGFAQLGRPQFRTMPKLSDSDIAMVRKLVREDLTGKPNGTTLSWHNPQTDNSGTVTLLSTFTSTGRDCRRVRYVVNPGKNATPQEKPGTYELNSCRSADGTWKLDSQARPDKS